MVESLKHIFDINMRFTIERRLVNKYVMYEMNACNNKNIINIINGIPNIFFNNKNNNKYLIKDILNILVVHHAFLFANKLENNRRNLINT